MLISMYKGLNLFATMQTNFRQIFLTRVNKAAFCKIDGVNDVFFYRRQCISYFSKRIYSRIFYKFALVIAVVQPLPL